jgi:integrase/recombinase XerD
MRMFLKLFAALGWYAPQELTPQRLLTVQEHLATQSLMDSTRHCYLKSLKCILAFLYQRGDLLFDLHNRIHLPRPERLPREVLSVREAAAILTTPDPASPLGLRNRAVLELLYSTGIRRRELINLHLADVDTDSAMLSVRKGKGGKDRLVPIGLQALSYLKRYIQQARQCFAFGRHAHLLFLSHRFRPLSETTIREIIHRAKLKTDVTKNVTTHTFRHSFAVGLLRESAPLPHIQQLLGHADLATTQIYTRVLPADLKAVHAATHPRERAAKHE